MADEECAYLLNEWGMKELIPLFKENLIDTAALRLLNEDDLRLLIKPIGTLSKFRGNWKNWLNRLVAAEEIENSNNSFTNEEDVIGFSNRIVSGITGDFQSQPQETTSILELGSVQPQCSWQDPPQIEANSPTGTIPKKVVTSTPTKKPYAAITIDNSYVNNLLVQTVDGRSILAEGTRNNGLLGASRRKELGRLIVRSLLDADPNFKIQSTTFTRLSLQIKEIFPKEGAAVYFSSSLPANANQKKKNASGVLYEAYISRRRKLRQIGELASLPRSRSPSVASKTSSVAELADFKPTDDNNTEVDTVILEHVQWLEKSVQPWTLVEIYWNDTAEYRLKYIESNPSVTVAEYFNRFPVLKTQEGIKLLVHDFDFKETGKGNNFFANIVLLRDGIIKLAVEKARVCRDKQLKNQIEELLSAVNDQWTDGHSLIAVLLIPFIISLPTGGLKKKGKALWKPSRTEVRDGFITTVKAEADVKTAVEERKETLAALGRTFQPLIVLVVGAKLDNNAVAFVVVDNTYYRFTSPLQAIDSAYKLFHATGANYPEESYIVWYFIQKALYHMITKYDRPCQSVLHLMSDLGCSKE